MPDDNMRFFVRDDGKLVYADKDNWREMQETKRRDQEAGFRPYVNSEGRLIAHSERGAK